MGTTPLLRNTFVIGLMLAWAPGARAIEPFVTDFGIGTFLHPLQDPGPVPGCECPKDHVYIFAVNGANPLCLGNFNGFCTYLKEHGYCHTYFGQLYTCLNWADRIRTIRRCDPEAKIVLIGFSAGCNSVRWIANDLARDCTRVDLLIYLVGDYVMNTPKSRPANVCRVANIRAKGMVFTGGDLIFNGADIDGARNCKLDCRHILVPSRKETLCFVMEELAGITCALPAGPEPAAVETVGPPK